MDRGIPLGNSLDTFSRRSLHVKIGNSSGEAIPVTGTLSGGAGFSSGTPAQVAVTNVSAIVMPANSNRKYARFSNFSGDTIWLQYNAAAAPGRGIRLKSGTIWTISSVELWLGDVHAISEGSSSNLDTMEGT